MNWAVIAVGALFGYLLLGLVLINFFSCLAALLASLRPAHSAHARTNDAIAAWNRRH